MGATDPVENRCRRSSVLWTFRIDRREERMADPVTHFELHVPDQQAAGNFYSELFGWHAQSVPVPGQDQPYTLVDTHAGSGINGGIGGHQEGQPRVIVYVETDDPQAALDKAASLGGTVLMPAEDIGMVILGLFTDPQGNTVGVVKNTQEAPGVSAGDGAPVDWFEILGPDPKALWGFYGDLFGWDVHGDDTADYLYGEVHPAEGKGIGGGIGSTPDGQPHVNIYAGVDDIQKYLDRAGELGGTTLMPVTNMGSVTFAMFADPQGTPFGLYRMEQES